MGLLASEVDHRPMQKIIDYVDKRPRIKAGNTAILVCVDAFSKFVWIVREATTKATIEALKEKIFCRFSVQQFFVLDNAQCFTLRELCQFFFGIRHVTTYSYYSQLSHAERFNTNPRTAIITYHSDTHSTWDHNLTWLKFAFNMAAGAQ